jgi:putative ABC transport system permease protein
MVLDGVSFLVIGVLPGGVRFFPQQVDVYLPLGLREGAATDPAAHGAIAGHRISVEWLADFGRDNVRRTMISLMTATVLLLMIACANVAGLLLLRNAQRLAEIATRSALGATYSRLARLLLTEILVYFALGGAVGWLLAELALQLLRSVAPQDIPRLWDARLTLPMLLALAVTLVSGVAVGLVSVVNLARLNRAGALDSRRGMAGPGGRQTLRSGLLVAEVALTIILLFSCNSLFRSLIAAQNVDPGFDADNVLAVDLQLPPHRYRNDAASAAFCRRLVDRVRVIPGVQAAGIVNCPPSTGGCARGWYSIPGLPVPSPADVPMTLLTTVDAGYFRALRMRWVAGRSFSGSTSESGDEVVVNEKLARRWWPQKPEAALGWRLKLGGPNAEGATKTIIGVVGDVNQEALDAEPASEIYVPGVEPAMVLMVRSSVDTSSLARVLRTAVESVDREVPVRSLQPLKSRMRSTLDRRQFTTWLFELFAALAAIMSAVGIYGVLSFQVQSRQKELAIRIAVGAGKADIMLWLARHLLGIGGAGVLIGIAGSVGAARVLAGMVFGIQPMDLSSLLTACSATLALAATAGAVPVFRAMRTDPLPELRS